MIKEYFLGEIMNNYELVKSNYERYWITKKSANVKVGDMSVTWSPTVNCPPSCPLLVTKLCYNQQAIRTKSMSDNIINNKPIVHNSKKLPLTFDQYIQELRELKATNNKLRLNVDGDLAPMKSDKRKISARKALRLSGAIKRITAFSYTHYPVDKLGLLNDVSLGETLNDREQEINKNKKHFDDIMKHNIDVVNAMNQDICINLSANNTGHAIALRKKYPSNPICSIVPMSWKKDKIKSNNIDGNLFVTCPAVLQDKANCSNCGNGKPLCSRKDRTNYIIGFPSHGAKKKQLDKLISNPI